MAQKFTRPITREVELAGERVALTFSESGVSARLVGSRAAPREIGWASLACALARGAEAPSDEEVAEAVKLLRGGKDEKANPKAAAKNAPAAGMKELLERLDRWLAKHRKQFLGGLNPGAGEKELTALETQLALDVPEALKDLLRWHNGQGEGFTGKFEQDWLLMSADRIPEAYRELVAGGAGNGSGTGYEPGWIPFLDDDGGNYLCLDTTMPEAPVRAFWLGNKQHEVVAPSLEAWLADFVMALEAGAYHEEPERGTLLRQMSAGERGASAP